MAKAIVLNDEYLDDILSTICKKVRDLDANNENDIGYQIREIYQKNIVPGIIKQYEELKDFLVFEQ